MFNTIVCADVLEHLIFPEKVLHFLVRDFLKNDGQVIISLPNIAHFSTRLSLLLGKFEYRESGILDKTHLHLYTQKSARKMIELCGLAIESEEFSSNNFGAIIKKVPFLGTILGYNLIYICRKRA
jgi:2-polyprenyl-3-methyl-5-hydroxy-6-metoxy-1,4-benzoquinol methylase